VPRNPLLAALIARHFEDEISFGRPPLVVQKAILGPLALLARRLGYRPDYSDPCASDREALSAWSRWLAPLRLRTTKEARPWRVL
jgi:hypothetical protein